MNYIHEQTFLELKDAKKSGNIFEKHEMRMMTK